jgi:competence protein ComFC
MFQAYIKPFVKDVSKFIFDLLFPMECFGCKQEETFLCEQCAVTLTKNENQICIVCKKPSISGITHPGCKTPHLPDGLISIYDYHDPIISEMIIAGKYKFIPSIYKTFGQLLASSLPLPLTASHYVLVPIPLSKSRRRWRGFNQAEVICEALSTKLGFPIAPVLVRSKSSKTQKDLKKGERSKNVEGAFSLDPWSPSPLARAGAPHILLQNEGTPWGDAESDEAERLQFSVHGKNFILVDDVITTGATILEAAKVLKRNGAKEVWCLTIARD